MEIEGYLNIIKIFEIKEENPDIKTIIQPLIENRNLDAVSYMINIKPESLKKYIDYVDILQNLENDIEFMVNNYNVKKGEYFPFVCFDNIILNIIKGKNVMLKVYTLNTLNKLEFKKYNKIQVFNNTGLKIKNGNIF